QVSKQLTIQMAKNMYSKKVMQHGYIPKTSQSVPEEEASIIILVIVCGSIIFQIIKSIKKDI
uniref:Uncharacterized protein n=1 Tax=Marmota marmota marmota TaxID=9994 RepID=A0A8C5YTP2_MARMA